MAKYALVIGINRYASFSNLKSAAQDAEAIAQRLEQQQYRVTRLPRKLVSENQWAIDADKMLACKELKAELVSFFRERADNQEALLYFAGHGFRVPDELFDEEEGFLAPSDATRKGQNAIKFDSLNKLIAQADLSSLVVLMDCCYAGSLLEQRQLLQPTQTTLNRKQNSCFIAACRDFERAREGKAHGIFTAAVLQGLSAENAVQGTITSNDLYSFVERELRASGQEAIHASMGGAIDLVYYAECSDSSSKPTFSKETSTPRVVEANSLDLQSTQCDDLTAQGTSSPDPPGGQVDLDSNYYVERPPTETNCYETILQPGALIRIKAPRQMGKTSLMSRVLRHAEMNQCLTVLLSFQLADAAIFSDLDKFLRWFCTSVSRRLRLPNRLADYWDEIFGSKDNCTAYFEEYLLPGIAAPLVLGLDEADMVFTHPNISADFMGLLRAWHESSKVNELWKKLRLVVVHSTEVYIPMNINQSPFNVGLAIELPEFTAAQVADLARRHGLNWRETEVNRLMAMVGGHPYLIRVALYTLTRCKTTLEALLAVAPTEKGPYGDHLARLRYYLLMERKQQFFEATMTVMNAAGPVRIDPIQAFQLHSMGIVNWRGNEVMPRCELYRRYFSDRLVAEG